MRKQAFTLVELIVVITILAILATIGFVSFSGYLAGTRDTNRIAQLKSMSDALELYRTKKDLPIPDDKVDVQASGTTIAYQGYIGANVLETIEYTEKGLDPKDKVYFSYYLTKDKKYFQLLSFLEEANTDIVAGNNTLLNSTQAVDYSGRFPKVTGKKLGILTDTSNTPIQELTDIIGDGHIDLYNVGTTEYSVHISDTEVIRGSGSVLSHTHPTYNCKRIKEIKGSSGDGKYIIDPFGDGVGFEVYCDMTTDGGGWMFFGHYNSDSSGHSFFEGGIGTYNSNRLDDGTKYSLGVDNLSHTEMMVTLDTKSVEEAEATSKLIFFNYDEGSIGFNTGPIPCDGFVENSYKYKLTVGGDYSSGGVSNCTSTWWNTSKIGSSGLLYMRSPSNGHFWAPGMGGDGSWNHEGWWYLR